MPRFIENLPWTESSPVVPQTITAPDGTPITVLPQQIILWVSIAERGASQLPPDAARIPVLYDTGFNDAFLIRADQFWNWCGPEFFRRLPAAPTPIRARGERLRTLSADLWLYPNVPGTSDISTRVTPFRMALPNGFALADVGSGLASLLPLLGLLAISNNRCRTTEDGATKQFCLDIP